MQKRSAAGDEAEEDGAGAAQPKSAAVSLRALARPRESLLLVTWLFALAWLTLSPGPPASGAGEPMSRFCLVCGDRGTADAILNLLAFLPLGIALGERRRAPLLALAAGVVLSTGIELTQILVPGRYPTFGDVVWNGLGAAAGAVAYKQYEAHLRAPRAWRGRAAAMAVGVCLVLAGWLLEHAPTDADYYAQWTADLGHMPKYGGSLLQARLDDLPMPDGRLSRDVRASERLSQDWVIETRLVSGPPPVAVSPILSVYDARRSEILLLGAHGVDLVLRERTRAKAILLDHPDLRLAGGLSNVRVGDTIMVTARRRGDDRCLRAAEREACGIGVTPGRTWGLLLYLEGASERTRRAVDTLWLLALLGAVGALSASPRGLFVEGMLVTGLVTVAVGLTRLTAPPVWEVGGALTGLVLGALVARLATSSVGGTGRSV